MRLMWIRELVTNFEAEMSRAGFGLSDHLGGQLVAELVRFGANRPAADEAVSVFLRTVDPSNREGGKLPLAAYTTALETLIISLWLATNGYAPLARGTEQEGV